MPNPRVRILLVILIAFVLSGCEATAVPTPTNLPPTATPSIPAIRLSSTAFRSGGDFPVKHTCDGDDVSPPLSWDDPPTGTQSFAIILDNPEAMTGYGWAHWILFNIPAESRGLSEAVPRIPELDDGSRHGSNSETWQQYTGPCPPFTQRFVFTLYALDTMLDLEDGIYKDELLQAMQGHILAEGEFTGRYKRQ
jgi:Raf kinase inhibitor-like YbhB/YbcL family protein